MDLPPRGPPRDGATSDHPTATDTSDLSSLLRVDSALHFFGSAPAPDVRNAATDASAPAAAAAAVAGMSPALRRKASTQDLTRLGVNLGFANLPSAASVSIPAALASSAASSSASAANGGSISNAGFVNAAGSSLGVPPAAFPPSVTGGFQVIPPSASFSTPVFNSTSSMLPPTVVAPFGSAVKPSRPTLSVSTCAGPGLAGGLGSPVYGPTAAATDSDPYQLQYQQIQQQQQQQLQQQQAVANAAIALERKALSLRQRITHAFPQVAPTLRTNVYVADRVGNILTRDTILKSDHVPQAALDLVGADDGDGASAPAAAAAAAAGKNAASKGSKSSSRHGDDDDDNDDNPRKGTDVADNSNSSSGIGSGTASAGGVAGKSKGARKLALNTSAGVTAAAAAVAAAASANMQEVWGAPNFRQLPGSAIAATAQPTAAGVRAVLNMIRVQQRRLARQKRQEDEAAAEAAAEAAELAQSGASADATAAGAGAGLSRGNIHSSSSASIRSTRSARGGGGGGGRRLPTRLRVQWINVREEPVLYIADRPFVLRELEHPLRNLADFQGINPARLNKVEGSLCADVIAEAAERGGNVMIHDEDEKGNIKPCWAAIGAFEEVGSGSDSDRDPDDGPHDDDEDGARYDDRSGPGHVTTPHRAGLSAHARPFANLWGSGANLAALAAAATPARPPHQGQGHHAQHLPASVSRGASASSSFGGPTPSRVRGERSVLPDASASRIAKTGLKPVGKLQVQTAGQMFETLSREEGYNVFLTRVPLTADSAPRPRDFDRLVATFLQPFKTMTADEEVFYVFNCQMGRGRSTTGMIVLVLLQSCIIGFPENVWPHDTAIAPSLDAFLPLHTAANSAIATAAAAAAAATAAGAAPEVAAAAARAHTLAGAMAATTARRNSLKGAGAAAAEAGAISTTGTATGASVGASPSVVSSNATGISADGSAVDAIAAASAMANPALPLPPWMVPKQQQHGDASAGADASGGDKGGGGKAGIKKKGKKATAATAAATAAADCAREAESSRGAATMREFTAIDTLLRLLRYGTAVQAEVDLAVTLCGGVVDIRKDVYRYVRRVEECQSVEQRAVLQVKAQARLRRYMAMLCFHEYLREMQLTVLTVAKTELCDSTAAAAGDVAAAGDESCGAVPLLIRFIPMFFAALHATSFETWLKRRPEVERLLQTADITVDPTPSQLHTLTPADKLVFQRTGSVLSAKAVLKHDGAPLRSHLPPAALLAHCLGEEPSPVGLPAVGRESNLLRGASVLVSSGNPSLLASVFLNPTIPRPLARVLRRSDDDLLTLAGLPVLRALSILPFAALAQPSARGVATLLALACGAATFVESKRNDHAVTLVVASDCGTECVRSHNKAILAAAAATASASSHSEHDATSGALPGAVGAGAGAGADAGPGPSVLLERRPSLGSPASETPLVPGALSAAASAASTAGGPASAATSGAAALPQFGLSHMPSLLTTFTNNTIAHNAIASSTSSGNNSSSGGFGVGVNGSADGVHSELPQSAVRALQDLSQAPSTIWINVREEPVVFIMGEPFVLRGVMHPFQPMKEFEVGVRAPVAEAVEARLKQDVLAEASETANRLVANANVGTNINCNNAEESKSDTDARQSEGGNNKNAKPDADRAVSGASYSSSSSSSSENAAVTEVSASSPITATAQTATASLSTGALLVHEELPGRVVHPVLLSQLPTADAVQTPRELFESLKARGMAVDYHRVPLHVEDTPGVGSFDSLFDILDGALGGARCERVPRSVDAGDETPTPNVVINCHQVREPKSSYE